MKADSHVHTAFSCDSEEKMDSYIQEAKNKGIDWVCFTDHVDYNKEDDGYNYYSPEAFFQHFNKLKRDCKEQIELCAGIEFSEPHLYRGHLKTLNDLPYDFIIGSVHWVGNMFPCQKVREQYSAKEFYKLYWNEVICTVKNGGFDCLGHIDFPKRYYQEIYYQENIIKEIFKVMVDKAIVLEINTSSLRKGINKTMPDEDLLMIYKEVGGRYIVVGSDAHEAKDLGADNEIAKQKIRNLGLREAVFRERRMLDITD